MIEEIETHKRLEVCAPCRSSTFPLPLFCLNPGPSSSEAWAPKLVVDGSINLVVLRTNISTHQLQKSP